MGRKDQTEKLFALSKGMFDSISEKITLGPTVHQRTLLSNYCNINKICPYVIMQTTGRNEQLISSELNHKQREIDALMKYCSYDVTEALLKWTEGMRILRNPDGVAYDCMPEERALLLHSPLPYTPQPTEIAESPLIAEILQTPIPPPSNRKAKRVPKPSHYDSIAESPLIGKIVQTPIPSPSNRKAKRPSNRKAKRVPKPRQYDSDGNEDFLDSVGKSRKKSKRTLFYATSSDEDYCVIEN